MIDPSIISRFKKERYLLKMSESDFRDTVVRPLFLRIGFKDGRDLCGQFEEGKDTLFYNLDNFGQRLIWVVQTKKGKLNMSRKATENVITAITQLRTALETKIAMLDTRKKILPDFVMLVANGKINATARKHIVSELDDPKIRFMDPDNLIPHIDKHYPEFWLGIDAEKLPYLKNLKDYLSHFDKTQVLSDIISFNSKTTAVLDSRYVSLRLDFHTYKIKRRRGKSTRDPRIEQIPDYALIEFKDNLCLILGTAGTGKSTLLKRLGFILCDQRISEEKPVIIPILLRTVDIAKSNSKLVEICARETQKISSTDKPCFTAKDLIKGNLVVMIDAIDELSDFNRVEKVLGVIDEFIINYPKCKIILTSRDYPNLTNLDKLKRYKKFWLSDIDLEQAKKIVRNLHKRKSLPSEQVQEIIRRLQQVHGIDLNPLLVTIFVATTDFTRKDIPANITELFKKFTEMMLGRWDRTKGLDQQYIAPLKDFLLTRLAYEMHQRRIISISRDECKTILSHELKSRGKKSTDIDQLIHEAIDRSGLFRCFDENIEFKHLLLQEFFAGRGIPSSDLIPTLLTDQWWQRAIVFYYGENPEDSETLENIITNFVSVKALERFQASITIGLAIQACYLVKTVNKIEFYKWVIEGLSMVQSELVGEDYEKSKDRFPLMNFISFYLFSRDSVANELLEDHSNEILNSLNKKKLLKSKIEKNTFWIIVGLIESGCLKKAKEIIKKFKPNDKRLLLAIHLSCFLIKHWRITSKENRKIASNVCDKISPKIETLRLEILEEFKSEMLELQKNEIKALENKKQ